MIDQDTLRHDLTVMVNELRSALSEIGSGGLPQNQVVTDARDRLRYIALLTEQAASQTLGVAENIGDRLSAQQAEAAELARLTRSPKVRAFLDRLQTEHAESKSQLSEAIQAQIFQDLVGQVINKLLDTVQRIEDSLAHMLVDVEPDGTLTGPQVREQERISQVDIDTLFD